MNTTHAIFLSLVCGTLAASSSASAYEKNGVMGKSSLELNVSHGDSQASKDYLYLDKQLPSLLDKHNFAELEKIADNLRASNYCYPNGRNALYQFYSSMELPYRDQVSNETWNAHLQTLGQWQQQYPQSKTAPVALANAWINFAWKARGHGDIKDLKPEQKKDMDTRLAMAKSILDKAESAKDPCPFIFVQAQLLASTENWTHEQYDQVFNKAIAKFPNCYEIYFQKAFYLQPDYSGNELDWPNFAAKVSDKVGGTNGDKLYARIVWYIDSLNTYDSMFNQFPNLKWSRVEKGIQALQKEYPNSNSVLNEYLKLSLEVDKKPLSEKLLQKVGKNVDLTVWQTKLNFLRAIDDFQHR